MKRGIMLIVAAAMMSALALGCEESKPAAGGEVADTDLAVPADFADEAEKSITATNYKSELDSLEKEISAPE